VNALLAWEHRSSSHHAEFHHWSKRVGAQSLWTCSLTELGFIRVSIQVFGYTLPVSTAALSSLKRHCGGYLAVAPSPRLAAWASPASRTTDAYLVQLAHANGMELATFDAAIRDPAVFQIRKAVRHP
jgi:predicted nucleic acid-binding protein